MPDEIKSFIAKRIASTESLLELTDRSKTGRLMMERVRNKIISLLDVPPDFTVLIVPGGGTQQFSMLAYSLRSLTDQIYTIETDYWGIRARQEMEHFLPVSTAYTGKSCQYRELPSALALPSFGRHAEFFTSNNTTAGTQWPQIPERNGDIVRIVDMSSDLFGKLPEYEKLDIVIACAQKNFGISGISVVIIKNTLLVKIPPAKGYMSYRSWSDAECMHNTVHMLPLAVAEVCLEYIEMNGLKAIQERITACSSHVFRYLDESNIFQAHVKRGIRSPHNVTFSLNESVAIKHEDVLDRFDRKGFSGLKGHSSVGGFRASFYFGAHMGDAKELVTCLEEIEGECR